MISLKPSDKLVSAPPTGAWNRITDLVLVEGAGGYDLQWSYVNVGDCDLNGEVNIADITPIGLHYGKTSADTSWDEAQLADCDGNGEVNISDITPIGQNFLSQVSYFIVSGGTTELGPWEKTAQVPIEELGNVIPNGFSYSLPQMTFPTFCVTPVDAAGVTGESGLLTGDSQSPFSQPLTSNIGTIGIGASVDLIFSVGIEPYYLDGVVSLVRTDGLGQVTEIVGEMADDGNAAHGDITAWDNLFSFLLNVSPAQTGEEYFAVKVESWMGNSTRPVLSNEVQITYGAALTEERFGEILDQFDITLAQAQSLLATTPPTVAFRQVSENLAADPTIQRTGVFEDAAEFNGVWWVTQECVPCSITDIAESSTSTALGTIDTHYASTGGSTILADGLAQKEPSSRCPATATTRIGNNRVLKIGSDPGNGCSYSSIKQTIDALEDHEDPGFDVEDVSTPNFRLSDIDRFNEFGIILLYVTTTSFVDSDNNRVQAILTDQAVTVDTYQTTLSGAEARTWPVGMFIGTALQKHATAVKEIGVSAQYLRQHLAGLNSCLVFSSFNQKLPTSGQQGDSETFARSFIENGAAGYVCIFNWCLDFPGTKYWDRLLFTELLGGRTLQQATETVSGSFISPIPLIAYFGEGNLVITDDKYPVIELAPVGRNINDVLYSEAFSVNDQGVAVGVSTLEGYVESACTWDHGQGQSDITLGGLYGSAVSINELGDYVGNSNLSPAEGGHDRAFQKTARQASLWPLSSLNDERCQAAAINNSGLVAGWSTTADPGISNYGVIWPALTQLPIWGEVPSPPLSGECRCLDINNNGLVLGWATDYEASGGQRVNFTWSVDTEPKPENMYRLQSMIFGELTNFYGANAINDTGTIIGGNWLDNDGNKLHGSIYNSGTVREIGTSGFYTLSITEGLDINSRGWIVGYESQENGLGKRAFLYQDDVYKILNDVIRSDSTWNLQEARGISDNGHIVGVGLKNGARRGFMLCPP